MQHNNPSEITLWELKRLFPEKPSPDFVLSLGTGCTESIPSNFSSSSYSPVKDRFVSRIYKTFVKSIDGEKIWQKFYNSLPDASKHRYHRVNLKIKGPEPAIDDVTALQELQHQASLHSRRPDIIQPILDSIYATMFYFEFDEPPFYNGASFSCIGHIFCRIALPVASRKLLYRQLQASSSYFLIAGKPVPCVDKISSGIPLFKRKVTFELDGLDQQVAITLRGITSQPHTISGLPRSANTLIEMQGLEAAFGSTDHALGKPLPQVPAKRKFQG